MSRIGKKPISVPKGVEIKLNESNYVTVKGPKGSLEQQLPPDITIKQENGVIEVSRPSDANQHRALHGLTRSLLANMVTGVTDGYQRVLEISGVGYRAAVQGKNLQIALGYSHDVIYPIPEGISIATPKPTEVVVTGIDKQKVGQVAAEIREFRKPEPYKGKGVKYAGEFIFRKEGKKK
jgi:large subunit ribosomal protein L6